MIAVQSATATQEIKMIKRRSNLSESLPQLGDISAAPRGATPIIAPAHKRTAPGACTPKLGISNGNKGGIMENAPLMMN